MPSIPSRGAEDDPRPCPPPAPEPGDCCGEGCAHCVLDIYDDALERYQAALMAWRLRHSNDRDEA